MVSALHIIFTILKILGIAILIILGIAIALLLMVLFVPVGYKAKGQFNGMEMEARADVSWMFNLIHFRAIYEYSKPFHMKLKILGIPFYDNIRKHRGDDKPTVEPEPDKMLYGEIKDMEECEIGEEDDGDEDEGFVEYATLDEKQIEYQEPEETDESPVKNSKNKNKINILEIFGKISGIFKKIRFTFTTIYDNIKVAKDSVKYYLKLWNLESTKAAFEQCKRQIFKLLKLISPRKYRINLHLGFDDPAVMGEVLAIWGMMYPWHMGRIDIKPEFETAALEGNFKVKGRICIISVVKAAFILYFDKNIKLLINRLKRSADKSREVEYGR